MNRHAEIRSELNRLRRWFIHETIRGAFRVDPVNGLNMYSRCSFTAAIFTYEFGGRQTGYLHQRGPNPNNSAIIVAEGLGHDFCIVDNRWLVDFWAWYKFHERDLYDLRSPEDNAIVDRLYGDRTKWFDTREQFLEWRCIDVVSEYFGVIGRLGYELRKF